MKDRSLIYAILCLTFTAIPIARHVAMKMQPVDVRFTATDGAQVDLASMRGKVVLVDFWATWCPACREEVPNVVAAYSALHAKGFEVIGISLDVDRGNLEAFTAQNGMVWPQYFDGKAWSNLISSRYGIHSIPAMWLINKNGRIADTDAQNGLTEKVEKLLAQ